MFNYTLKAQYGLETVQNFYQRFMVDLEHYKSLDLNLTLDLLWMIDASKFKAAMVDKIREINNGAEN